MTLRGIGITLSPHRRSSLIVALLAAALSCLLLTACVTVKHRVAVQTSPETVSPEIEGARWLQTSIPIHYCLDPDNGFESADVVLQLLEKAFTAWGVPTVSDGICTGPVSTADGRNEISWTKLSQTGADLTEAGKASLRYRIPTTGAAQIIEADIEIDNNAPRSRRNQDCLYTTILHETGHFLGLHHLATGTVMAPIVTDCLQNLTPPDKQAISQLY